MFNFGIDSMEENITVRSDGSVESTWSISFSDGSFGRSFTDGEIRFCRKVR